jgi:hypothetical protein
VFSFFSPMWESDVTARAAVEQSVSTSVADVGTAAVMAGAEASLEGSFRDALASYGFSVDGGYERVFQVSLGSGQSAPSDSASARVGGGAGWTISPFTELSFGARGYLATRLGVRAADALAARDPFLFGNRLQYTITGGPDLSFTASHRTSVHVGGSYEQAGALSADDPKAVGVDAHTGRAALSLGYELGAVDTVSPEFRYEIAHYYHALLDTELRRGEAELHAVSALVSESHDFSRNLTGQASGGVTVASPPPVVRSRDAVVAPAARAGLTYVAKSYRLTASYAYEYRSLGPRIGFGQQHDVSIEVAFRPLPGGAHRDLVVTGVGRFSAGGAPVAASPPLHVDLGAPPPPTEGRLSATTAVAGAEIEVPLARGLVLRGGLDLEYLHAALEPAPAAGSAGASLRTVFTAALAGTLSTNKLTALRRDPDSAWDDERRDAMIRGMPSGRWQSPERDRAERARADDAVRGPETEEPAGPPQPASDGSAAPDGAESTSEQTTQPR